jgi:hypothetical protein
MDMAPRVCWACDKFKPVLIRDERGRPTLVYCHHSMGGCERLNEYLKGEEK